MEPWYYIGNGEKSMAAKKENEPIKLKRNFNYAVLPDAMSDGKFQANVDARLVVGRSRNGKQVLTICTVKKINENGLIETWDETLQQWFAFNVSEAPKIIKIMN
jgi:hypothetical protein